MAIGYVYLLPCCDGGGLYSNSQFLSVTTSLVWLQAASRGGWTVVIGGCCYFIEGYTAIYGSPNFTGADGYIDSNSFSPDNCATCKLSNPCPAYSYTMEPCDLCCGTSGIQTIQFGCDSGFVPSSLVGEFVSVGGCCYEVTSYVGPASGNAGVVTFGPFGDCPECQSFYPCPSPSPTPTRSVTPTPSRTPSVTPSRTPSVTPSRTPSVTPTRTPSPTSAGGGASVTPTRTPSPTPTPSPSPCSCSEYVIDGLDPTHTVNYTDCNGFAQSLNDVNYWLNTNTLTLCACTNPVVVGGPFFGGITKMGPCGECQCTQVDISIDDINAADGGLVYFYYQCCDGLFGIETLASPGITNFCISRVIGILIYQGGNLVPANFSTATSTGPCCSGTYTCNCGTMC
jgi:hypothetical protein